MNILEIFTKNNIRILELISKEELHMREIAEKLKISPASVHNFSKNLKSNNMLTEKKVKNKLVLELNRKNPLTKLILALLNYNKFTLTKAYKKLKKTCKIGVYGSYAEGTNDSESDLDFWIKTEESELRIRPMVRELEQELGIRVNPFILTAKKLEKIRKEDPEFYIRLKLSSKGDELDG